MTENTMTLVDVSPPRSGEPPEQLPPLTAAEQEDTIRELVRQARASGTSQPRPTILVSCFRSPPGPVNAVYGAEVSKDTVTRISRIG